MRKAIEVKSMEVVLLFLIPIFRLTLAPVQNISILINDLSSILVLFLPLYLFNRVIKQSKKGGNIYSYESNVRT